MVESGQLIAHELTGDLAAEVVKARSAEHFESAKLWGDLALIGPEKMMYKLSTEWS